MQSKGSAKGDGVHARACAKSQKGDVGRNPECEEEELEDDEE